MNLKDTKISFLKILIPIAAISFVSVGGVLATYTSTKEMKGNVALGKIDIETKLEMLNEEEYIDYVPPKLICPGMKVNQRLTISSKGQNCWIRLKPVIQSDITLSEEEQSNLIDFIDSSKWTLKTENDDIYYYYNQEVQPDEDIIAYNGLNIPNWGNESKGKNLNIDVIVQAIQSKNLEQDLTAASPWNNDVEIIEFTTN